MTIKRTKILAVLMALPLVVPVLAFLAYGVMTVLTKRLDETPLARLAGSIVLGVSGAALATVAVSVVWLWIDAIRDMWKR